MQRRRFLEIAVMGTVGWLFQGGLLAVTKRNQSVNCHLAGVEYQDIDLSNLKANWRVTLKRDWYGDKPCYTVMTIEGVVLGYIPRSLVPYLETREVMSVRLLNIKPHAVPWKQLEIAMVFK